MLKHLGANGLARGLRAVTQAVLLIILARDVGPAGFGVIAAFLAAHTVLFVVAGMGTPTFVIREVALGNSARARAAIRLNSLTLLFAGVVALFTGFLLISHPLLFAAVVGNVVGLLIERFTENRLAVAYGQQRIHWPVVTLIGQALLPLVVYLSLDTLGMNSLAAFALARVASGVAGQLVALLVVRLPDALTSYSARDMWRAQASYATNTAMVMVRSLDSVIVISIVGAAPAGIYSAASRVMAPFTILAVSMGGVLVPRAALASPARMRRRLDQMVVAGLVLSSLTLVLAPLSESLMAYAFGPEFSGGGPVLIWALLRSGPEVATPLIAAALQARGFERRVAFSSLATSVLTLGAVGAGAILGGAVGAAAGFAVVGLLGMLVLWALSRWSLSRGQLAD